MVKVLIKIKLEDGVNESEALHFVKNVLADRKTSGTVVGMYLKCHVEVESAKKTCVVEKIRQYPQPKSMRPNA